MLDGAAGLNSIDATHCNHFPALRLAGPFVFWTTDYHSNREPSLQAIAELRAIGQALRSSRTCCSLRASSMAPKVPLRPGPGHR